MIRWTDGLILIIMGGHDGDPYVGGCDGDSNIGGCDGLMVPPPPYPCICRKFVFFHLIVLSV